MTSLVIESEKAPDFDEQTIDSQSDDGAVVEERDIRKKQIFKGGVLFWSALLFPPSLFMISTRRPGKEKARV